MPPRLTACGGVDAALLVATGQAAFEGCLFGKTQGDEAPSEHPQPFTPPFGRQPLPPAGVVLAQFFVRDLAFGFPAAAVTAAPRGALGRDVRPHRCVIVVRARGQGQVFGARPAARGVAVREPCRL